MIEITPQNPVGGDNISVRVFNNAGPCAISSSFPSSQITDNYPVFTLSLDCTGGILFYLLLIAVSFS